MDHTVSVATSHPVLLTQRRIVSMSVCGSVPVELFVGIEI